MANSSILDNRFNEMIFKHNINKSPSLKRQAEENEPFVLELMDRVYSGRNNPDYINYEYIKKLEEISFLNVNMKGCTGSIISTTELAEMIVSQIEMNKDIDPGNDNDKSENEQNNEMVKAFTSKKFMDQVSNSNEAQDKVEALFSTAGSSIDTEDLSEEEIQSRRNILHALKNKNYRSHIKNIVDCFGYFYAFASVIRKENLTDLPLTPTDVVMGNDLKNVLPSELGYLDSEELLPLFAKKIINKEFLQFKMKGKEAVGKGNLVLGLDISDSMQEHMYNSPVPSASKLAVALGFSLAIMKVLYEQGRDFKLFTFNYSIVQRFDSKTTSYHTMIKDIINISCGGGTSLIQAINEGISYGKDNYDFIMVSDCEDDLVTQHTQQILENKTHRFSTLVIPSYGYSSPYKNLKGICDSFITSDGPEGFKHEIGNIIK